MVTVELMVIELKDGVDGQSPEFKRFREAAAKAGIIHQSYGTPIENAKQLYWVLSFDQGFEPKDLVWPEKEYGDFFREVLNIATAEPVSYFIPFDAYPEKAVTAPVTEIAVITLKGDVDAYTKLQDVAILELQKSPSVHEARYGITKIGEKQAAVAFVGWASVETHQSWAKANREKLQAAGAFVESATLVHVPLKLHV
ncbi:hypothetical protein DAEQUDRAFT_815076 [Daedalea quercina L-15889]|uniref:ABM domain-containing protein n=1 Tax=Daedalea quercina L-15889 TaxID=1314783 RepID=A0A165LE44_9APHY|nr:hypothetical protein DAEQUDRAFT_815076 [Daedalea quercina L-15889]